LVLQEGSLQGASGTFFCVLKMINTILGQKTGMSQAFVKGLRVPVTKVLAGPCVVTQVKKMDKDGYWAVQLGFGQKKIKNVTKPLQGHLKATIKDGKAPRYIAEVRLDKEPELQVGDSVKASDIFRVGDVVNVTGVSKGKGFAGVVKRHHFHGGPHTHGQSDRERAPGSIGQTTTPGRVLKGKKMAGRMGGDTVTVRNLHIISVNPETNEIQISGQIPGIPGGFVRVKRVHAGSLEELEHETVEKIVEGEAPAGEGAEAAQAEGQAPAAPAPEAPSKEVKPNEQS